MCSHRHGLGAGFLLGPGWFAAGFGHSKLDVDIRLTLEELEQGSRVAYQPNARVILMPPFELFFSAADYYLSLAHELIHWADDSTALVGSGPARATALRGWRELVAEFGAVFVCDKMGVEGIPNGLPTVFVTLWRDEARLSDTEVLEAAETAGNLTTWLCELAPGWRAPRGDRKSCITREPADTTAGERHAALVADVRARAFVISAEALGKMDPGEDPDAWEREAARLLEMAGQIDLTIPDDDAAIEAAVDISTPLDATPVAAATWLKAFQERTMRIRAMRDLTRSAGKTAETKTIRRSIKP